MGGRGREPFQTWAADSRSDTAARHAAALRYDSDRVDAATAAAFAADYEGCLRSAAAQLAVEDEEDEAESLASVPPPPPPRCSIGCQIGCFGRRRSQGA